MSDEVVDAGDDTQSFRKVPSPTRKSSWRSKLILADGCEKTLVSSGANTVAAPPGLRSNRSAASKVVAGRVTAATRAARSEEPTSELQSLMRISYAVFCLQN